MTHIIRTLAVALLVMLSFNAFSQNVGINADGSEPDSRTILDVKSTNKGVLLPRLSDTERDALYQNVPNGMLIFNTTVNQFQVFVDNVWYPISMGTGIPASDGIHGTVSDNDGNTYNTVKIGEQWWMAENLKTTKYNDGITPIATTWGTTPSYAWYNNDINNKPVYGALYNWYAVDLASTGGKNVCPVGWHVPTDAEWTTLTNYIAADGHSGTEGTALKATSGWNYDGNGTDNYGFAALPSGYRTTDGTFNYLGDIGYYWSSTADDASDAWDRGLDYLSDGVFRGNDGYKENGFAVRCVKD